MFLVPMLTGCYTVLLHGTHAGCKVDGCSAPEAPQGGTSVGHEVGAVTYHEHE